MDLQSRNQVKKKKNKKNTYPLVLLVVLLKPRRMKDARACTQTQGMVARFSDTLTGVGGKGSFVRNYVSETWEWSKSVLAARAAPTRCPAWNLWSTLVGTCCKQMKVFYIMTLRFLSSWDSVTMHVSVVLYCTISVILIDSSSYTSSCLLRTSQASPWVLCTGLESSPHYGHQFYWENSEWAVHWIYSKWDPILFRQNKSYDQALSELRWPTILQRYTFLSCCHTF